MKKLLYIEDSLIEKNILDSIIETIQNDYPKEKLKTQTVSLCCEKNHSISLIEKIKKAVQLADIIVFDYGGLMSLGMTGFVDHWNRFFIKTITEFCSKDWRCVSNLNTFENEEKEQLEKLGVSFRW